VLAVFLRFWKPKNEWHFGQLSTESATNSQATDAHAASAQESVASLLGSSTNAESAAPLTTRSVIKAWTPFALMSLFLMLLGFVRQAEGKGPLVIFDAGSITLSEATPDNPGQKIRLRLQTMYEVPIPWLHKQVERAGRLQKEGLATPEREGAVFKFVWLTAPGTPVLFAAIVSIWMLRMTRRQVWSVVRKTIHQMRVPIPTIACMLGLSYVTRYAGMDATLGIAFAETGVLYPFFAAILGWLGVFLTGTDAGSNALFGSLQKITATEVHKAGAFAYSGLTLDQSQVLICTANSTGGVMGKMIDAQSICVATAATNRIGREADIFKAVIWHSIILASIVGLITLVQAYLPPFSRLVP
jgi:lactate permease